MANEQKSLFQFKHNTNNHYIHRQRTQQTTAIWCSPLLTKCP